MARFLLVASLILAPSVAAQPIGIARVFASGSCASFVDRNMRPGMPMTLVRVPLPGSSDTVLVIPAVLRAALPHDSTCGVNFGDDATPLAFQLQVDPLHAEPGFSGVTFAFRFPPNNVVRTRKTAAVRIEAGKPPVDLRACNSAEGLHFTAVAGSPPAEKEVFHAYYAVGYDMTPNCPPFPPAWYSECERPATVSASGVGIVRIGMPIDSVKRVCRVQSSQISLGSFGAIAHTVRIGPNTLQVWESAGHVRMIQVTSPAHRTRDSIGVGTPAERILEEPDLHHGPGDTPDRYFLSPRQGPLCGLSFWLEPPIAEIASRARGDILHIIRMRGPGAIASIDVHGPCGPSRSP